MEQHDLERIEAYLLGKMSETERRGFQRELQSNQQLAAAVASHQKLVHGVQEHLFRQMLAEISEEAPDIEHTGPGSRWLRSWWQVAAAVLVLGGLLWLLWPQATPEYLASIDPIQLDPGLPTPLGPTQSLEFAEGMNAYKMKQYAEARTYWNPLWQQHPQNDTLLFMLSQVDLAEEKWLSAIEKLEAIDPAQSLAFGQKSTWYLALAKLKSGNIPEAKQILEEIAGDSNPWSERARSLLEKLHQH